MSSKGHFFKSRGLRENWADGAEDQEGKGSRRERITMMVLGQKNVGYGKV